VIVLAVAAYVVYHIVSTGTVQPLTIILLILLGFGLVRSLFRMRRKVQEESESE
jgi:Flp pilus assembly protein TadB